MRRIDPFVLLVALLGSAPVGAENLLANPDFHADRADWVVDVGWNPDWLPDDENACGGSGSIYALSQQVVSAVHWVWIQQCRPLPPDDAELSLAGRYRATSLFPDVSLSVGFYDNELCEGPSLAAFGAESTPPAVDTWSTLAEPAFPVPSGTTAYRFSLYALTSASFEIQFDRLYLGPGEPIFRDDFEADLDGESTPCRWSSTSGAPPRAAAPPA